ncbi:MAG: XdhC family protein [Chloroflexi bacterium]|nr:XdhC family protein [Chloroflexota bacterium]MCI0579387.1 XdhC family protein [Chloroflexota bacterium]MCI0643787.1 XdhC family protein [Chloroflexota bacterium]MCI0730025.1 XdhC family protein [Chloroflexota bacterium]
MRDVIPDLDQWQIENVPVALATVVQTWGSAPRREGAKMALTPDGRITGSVSGGCVEGAVFEAGVETLETGRPQLLHFGVADETAWDVGLACGGTIEVFVEPLDRAVYDFVRSLLAEERPAATATVIRGPAGLLGKKLVVQRSGRPFGEIAVGVDGVAAAAAHTALAVGRSQRLALDLPDRAAEPVELFIEVLLPSPTLIMVGGVHIAVALATLAKTLGYQTIVVDPRRAFGSEARFPHVDQLIQAWPDEAFRQVELNAATAVTMLTHDPKIDDPALKIVLPSQAFYVGALGSKKTHNRRRERLLAAGVAEEQVNRIHAPIGLEIGAQTPEEIALAIMAEITAARRKAEVA